MSIITLIFAFRRWRPNFYLRTVFLLSSCLILQLWYINTILFVNWYICSVKELMFNN
jgi:hypothetical protein